LREEAVADAGIWRLPRGAALYQAMILHMTDTTLSPQQIHGIGLAEVARITAERRSRCSRRACGAGGVSFPLSWTGKK